MSICLDDQKKSEGKSGDLDLSANVLNVIKCNVFHIAAPAFPVKATNEEVNPNLPRWIMLFSNGDSKGVHTEWSHFKARIMVGSQAENKEKHLTKGKANAATTFKDF